MSFIVEISLYSSYFAIAGVPFLLNLTCSFHQPHSFSKEPVIGLPFSDSVSNTSFQTCPSTYLKVIVLRFSPSW